MLFHKKNKKGLANQIILLIVMAVVIVLIVLLGFIVQLTGPIFNSAVQDTRVIFTDTIQSTENPALISANEASFEPAADSLNNMEWLSYTMFIVAILAFLIMCFYVRVYPFLLFIWIILIVVLTITSIYMAVVYQDMRQDPTYGAYYQSWENTDFMLRNLPIIVVAIGIVGGIIMFSLASRSPEVEISNGSVPL